MSFGQSVSHVLANLTNFSGRASRSEFWWWYVFTIILSAIAWGIENLTGLRGDGTFAGILTYVVGFVLFLATLAVAVRRLHDTGRSGWWVLLYFLCCIGQIILIVFWVQASQPTENTYGSTAA